MRTKQTPIIAVLAVAAIAVGFSQDRWPRTPQDSFGAVKKGDESNRWISEPLVISLKRSPWGS